MENERVQQYEANSSVAEDYLADIERTSYKFTSPNILNRASV